MLTFIATAAAFHVVPNILMKIVKKTHAGHRVLTASFVAGVEMGRSGLKISSSMVDAVTYGVGPEAMVEYQLGLEFGRRVSFMSSEMQEAFISGMKQEIVDELAAYSDEDVAVMKAAPGLGTVICFATGDYDKSVVALFMKASCPDSSRRSKMGIAANLAALAGLTLLDPHVLIQPAICWTRKKVGTSEYGKNLMKENFVKGNEGKLTSKPMRAVVDMVVSPSVLDTMRLGYVLNKYGFNAPALEKAIAN